MLVVSGVNSSNSEPNMAWLCAASMAKALKRYGMALLVMPWALGGFRSLDPFDTNPIGSSSLFIRHWHTAHFQTPPVITTYGICEVPKEGLLHTFAQCQDPTFQGPLQMHSIEGSATKTSSTNGFSVFYQVNREWGEIQSITAKPLILLNQRCRVVVWYIQYMVLLQELLHPPRASRDDCGERIADVGIPLRVANFVYSLLGFCAVFSKVPL